MKNIPVILLTVAVSACMLSCSKDLNNDAFSEMLGEQFNQKLKWNPDSLSFVRASWEKTSIAGGGTIDKTVVKMWEGMQSVTRVQYTPAMYTTRIANNPSGISVGDAAIADGKAEELVPIFAIDGCTPALLVVDNEVVIEKTTGSDYIGVLVITENEGSSEADIIECTPNEFPILKSQYNHVLAGGTMLVNNGEALDQPATERSRRTIIGVNDKGNITMMAVNADNSGNADGVTLAEAAFIARVSGMVNAMCIGDSATSLMWTSEGGNVGSTTASANPGTVIYAVRNQPFEDGNGSADSPYQIATKRQMDNMHNVLEHGKSVYFELVKDIDMSGVDWIPLNYASPYDYRIVFDGKGHTISNFTCDYASYASFFGVLYGECRNVFFKDVSITAVGGSCTGTIGGYVGTGNLPGLVEQVKVTGTLRSLTNNHTQLGGIAGQTREGTIRNCYVDVTMVRDTYKANQGCGGIVGQVRTLSSIENCYAMGSIDVIRYDNAGAVWGRTESKDITFSITGNIGAMSKIIGNWSSGRVGGRTDRRKVTGTAVLSDNYGWTGTVMELYKDNETNTSPAYKDGYGGSSELDCVFDGADTGSVCEAAKKIGWDESIWDLSGEYPRFVWE